MTTSSATPRPRRRTKQDSARVADEALRQYLSGPQKKKFRLKLTPRSAVGHLMPGVDLQDRDSLYEIADGLR
jgi:hypothetical protein